MYNITLLSSFHRELGKCNSTELYKIIEEIRPDVIFEELPPDIFNIIYNEDWNPQSLEAITIKKYLRTYQIEHFPVDTCEKNETDLFSGYDIISNRNIEYLEFFKQHLSFISQHGYSFLNSDNCVKLIDKMHILEESVLLDMNDTKLLHQYKSDRELDNRRENEMLDNIYNYSKQYPYDRALFICGAEHRKTIKQKIQARERVEKSHLNWLFYNN
ncbi:hypothetical protein [Niabella beijingensis]|uniref:hypothetical protein n=1 Tax=Niabella beijingensis TaxID=2872700 RepID=UPI001CC17C02|nr:hypothetical protein [Niabella beijingensis]MBZ4191567.1 hypothetical protein [Niabella beijingensis]